MLTRQQLQQAAADSGFQVESYEKVYVLVRLLEAVRTHPFLGARMALKGGTALNLFSLRGLDPAAYPARAGHGGVSTRGRRSSTIRAGKSSDSRCRPKRS
jgi:hypothetical protein